MIPAEGVRGVPPAWHVDATRRPKGHLDESARRLFENERFSVRLLVAQGNTVVANRESGKVRVADVTVNGIHVELKRVFSPVDSNKLKNRINEAIEGSGQARHVVIDGRGTDITVGAVDRTFRRMRAARVARGKLDYVRFIADTFDRTYSGFG